MTVCLGTLIPLQPLGHCIKFKPTQFNFNANNTFETKDYCAFIY